MCARLGRHGRAWIAIFWIGYAIRATVWICGGNLPLVPGDSCHYLEVATSVYRGEGPVKHYVESFFTDYPRIRQGQGVLDDWATPLDAYVRAAAFGWRASLPCQSLESTVGVAKACSFAINFSTLPLLYVFGLRRFGREVGLGPWPYSRSCLSRDLRGVRAAREPRRAHRPAGSLDLDRGLELAAHEPPPMGMGSTCWILRRPCHPRSQHRTGADRRRRTARSLSPRSPPVRSVLALDDHRRS